VVSQADPGISAVGVPGQAVAAGAGALAAGAVAAVDVRVAVAAGVEAEGGNDEVQGATELILDSSSPLMRAGLQFWPAAS
jgi:hypothetical protein